MALSLLDAADPNLITLQMTARSLEMAGVQNARLRVDGGITGVEPPEFVAAGDLVATSSGEGAYDAILILQPKGRSLLRRWLLEARSVLKPGGSLFLAGANDEGIQAGVKDAGQVFGQGVVLAYQKGCRVVKFMASEELPVPEWAGEAGIIPGSWQDFSLRLNSHTFSIRSLPGVFSAGHLDEGSAMLLDHLRVEDGANVLDLGCGYGILGIAALRAGAARADLTDVNLLAVISARASLAANGLSGGTAFGRDVLWGVTSGIYDQIIANPPFHAGHEIQYAVAEALIEGSRTALVKGGRLTLVANRFIRYDRLMKSAFGQVSTLAENSKYYVLEAANGKR
jgi:16S rRNA (guanine1207-N2)-methyltransferase